MARKKTRLSKEERLAALKAKLDKTDTSSGGSGFWSPKEGRNTIRIFPEVDDMEFFFCNVGTHYMQEGVRILCPSFSTDGEEDCPVCDMVNDLYKSGKKADKQRAGEIRVRKQYWMNIVDRDDEKAGVKVFTAGPMIFGAIKAYIGDPDYGDITDEEDGADVIIEREGSGKDTDYQTKVARHDSPIHDDPDQVDDWFEDCSNLVVALLTDNEDEDEEIIATTDVYVPSYDRILQDYDLEALVYQTAPEDDDEDEEEEERRPAKRKVSKRRASRRRR